MLTIRGTHGHVPPPPKSIPHDIKEALSTALAQHDNILTLTSRMYISYLLSIT